MKILFVLCILILSCQTANSLPPLRTITNTYTGKFDYIVNLASATIGDLGFGPQVLDEGVLQGGATWFNFVGSGVTASVVGGTATITISGGGSGGSLWELDVDDNLIPILGSAADTLWELDIDDNIQPKI